MYLLKEHRPFTRTSSQVVSLSTRRCLALLLAGGLVFAGVDCTAKMGDVAPPGTSTGQGGSGSGTTGPSGAGGSTGTSTSSAAGGAPATTTSTSGAAGHTLSPSSTAGPAGCAARPGPLPGRPPRPHNRPPPA